MVAQLLFVAVAVAVGVSACFPPVRRGARAVWRCGRNLPWMLLAVLRWPRLAASSGLGRFKTVKHGERAKESPVNVPGTCEWRLTPAGFSFVVRHRFGQNVQTVRDAVPDLASGLCGQVRVTRVYSRKGQMRQHRSRVIVNRRDPYAKVPGPLALSATRFRLGVLEDGRDWLVDFRADPHLLGVGSTGSGKSGFQAAFLAALAPTDAVVCLIDLKHGISAEPYRPRASLVAETQAQAVDLLADLLRLGEARAELCKALGVDKVHDLPTVPPEVYVVVDEVAELGVDGGGEDGKALAKRGMTDLLRCVQLLRFAGIHVLVMGQRFGSSLGPQITNIRAQLTGRVCLRVADAETGGMAVGDIAPEAVKAALDIPEGLPGVAVVKGGPDGWQMGRTAFVPHRRLASVAQAHSSRRLGWHAVMGEAAPVDATTELPALAERSVA